MIIAFFCLYSCEKDPEYLLGFDRIDAIPDGISVAMNDAFFLSINAELPIDIEFDGISVYRLSNDDNSVGTSEFEKVQTMADINDSTVMILDTGALYGKYNFYTLTASYRDVESFFSDTVSIYFQMDAPQCTLQLTDSGIQQAIHNNYDFISGVEIIRASDHDTLIEYQPYNYDQLMYLTDSLHYDQNSPLDGFSTGLYKYFDLQPNTNYSYEIRVYQDNSIDRRYSSVFSADPINFQTDTLQLSTKAVTDTSVRLYCTGISSSDFDSLLVFILQDTIWELHARKSLSDQIYYNNKYIIDIGTSVSNTYRVTAKNNNYYTISEPKLSGPLMISGFKLLESGEFTWGCNEQIDIQCNDDEYPPTVKEVADFYISMFEISEEQYNSPHSWNTAIGSIPVDSISFIDAKDFCNVLNNLYDDYSFYIPTEVQWEYAAKFNYEEQSSTIYPWGNTIDLYRANYGYQNDGPIGIGLYDYPSNQGQYDMAGNVLEWVDNCYNEELIQNNDTSDCWKVVRGGAYWSDGSGIRTTQRYHLPQDQGFNGVGLRLAMEINN